LSSEWFANVSILEGFYLPMETALLRGKAVSVYGLYNKCWGNQVEPTKKK